MSTKTQFWIDVAEHISKDTGGEPPEKWTKSEIDPFLKYFHQQLQKRCAEDLALIAACGWQHPKNGAIPDGSTISYDSFRRIFITNESKGNRTTRNMFAIYMGYQSYDDYCNQHSSNLSHSPPPPPQETNSVQPVLKKTTDPFINTPSVKQKMGNWQRALLALFTISLLYLGLRVIALPTIKPNDHATQWSQKKKPFLIFRNDDGIAVMPTEGGEPVQVIKNRRYLTGMDYDHKSNLLFWANSNSSESYLGISCARLNSTNSQIIPGSLKDQHIKEVRYPAGIALYPDKEMLFCADYGDSTIKVFNYEGQLLDSAFGNRLPGKPSSVELDIATQKLYWTDVSNHKIGRIDLLTLEVEPDFISDAGLYPDGLSVNSIYNQLFWASPKSRQIGVADLDARKSKLINVDAPIAAVEVNQADSLLYCSLLGSDVIRKGLVTPDSVVFDARIPPIYTHGSRPSVLKISLE
ncbi:MAG: hypothetical protein RIC19_06520 [Phaeodactylibacter sp.]|uniref:YncE family protein n=1 Tax=Phaeodactylibacter sp. TaxID=1940289 RepID=UPI0032ED74AD